jgi:hypothetical protein
MTAGSVPFVALVVGMFATFIVTLGAVSVRLALADRREARLAQRTAAAKPTRSEGEDLSLAA